MGTAPEARIPPRDQVVYVADDSPQSDGHSKQKDARALPRLASTSRGVPGVLEEEGDDGDSEIVGIHLRSASSARTESFNSDTSGDRERLEERVAHKAGPALVIRRPIGSRRASFVCVKDD